jgi:hypothetical protein
MSISELACIAAAAAAVHAIVYDSTRSTLRQDSPITNGVRRKILLKKGEFQEKEAASALLQYDVDGFSII